MKEENCKHNYYIIRSFLVEHPYDLLSNTDYTKPTVTTPTYIDTGKYNVNLICGNCFNIKNIND